MHQQSEITAHTHLLRNILSNYCCGVHRACTNNPLKSDRKIGWLSEKTIVEEFFLCPCKKQLFHLTKSAVNQIAKTEQWIETCWHRSSEEGSDAAYSIMEILEKPNDMPVLGLAGRHWRKWKLVQVHGGDQSPLPPLWNSFVGTGIHNGPVPPAK